MYKTTIKNKLILFQTFTIHTCNTKSNINKMYIKWYKIHIMQIVNKSGTVSTFVIKRMLKACSIKC